MKTQFKLVSKLDKREMFRGTRRQCETYQKHYIASWRPTYIMEASD